jgi:hypothetical protein
MEEPVRRLQKSERRELCLTSLDQLTVAAARPIVPSLLIAAGTIKHDDPSTFDLLLAAELDKARSVPACAGNIRDNVRLAGQ